MGVFDDIASTQTPKPVANKAQFWVNILVEVDMNDFYKAVSSGSKEKQFINTKVISSFTKPAKDSTVKYIEKRKKLIPEVKLVTEESEQEKSLF